jgi:hypothetical protein
MCVGSVPRRVVRIVQLSHSVATRTGHPALEETQHHFLQPSKISSVKEKNLVSHYFCCYEKIEKKLVVDLCEVSLFFISKYLGIEIPGFLERCANKLATVLFSIFSCNKKNEI